MIKNPIRDLTASVTAAIIEVVTPCHAKLVRNRAEATIDFNDPKGGDEAITIYFRDEHEQGQGMPCKIDRHGALEKAFRAYQSVHIPPVVPRFSHGGQLITRDAHSSTTTAESVSCLSPCVPHSPGLANNQ